MISPGVRGDAAASLGGAGAGIDSTRRIGATGLVAGPDVLIAASAALKIGAGCEPDCMNRTLISITTMANAPTANPTASLARHRRTRKRKGRRRSASPGPP